jgi:transposase
LARPPAYSISVGSDWTAEFLITPTFSKNRHGRIRESDALRRLFESVVQRCIAEGLVGADGFAVDVSLIAVDANKQ